MNNILRSIKHLLIIGTLAVAVSSCSCSDKDCKSSRDCKDGAVCRNGKCVISGFSTSTDSTTATLGWNTDYGTGSTSTSVTDTGSNTNTSIDTDTASNTDTASDTTTSVDTVSDTSDDTRGSDCSESWQCNDDNACTTESCVEGLCVTTQTTPLPEGCCNTNAECDDGNSCTADQCNTTSFLCENTSTSGNECCTNDNDCNDNNSCTIDSCTMEGTCIHIANTASAGCCDDVNDCGSSSCSVLTCMNYRCDATFPGTLAEGCCLVDDDCPASTEACAVASCNDKGECEYETNPAAAENCCMTDDDCDDGNNCNVDDCTYQYQCIHRAPVTPAPGCCLNDGDCTDGNNCTVDACVDNVCTTGTPTPLPAGCCDDASDCNDSNDCTRDICASGKCHSAGDPTLGADCCYEDGDCDDSNGCTIDSCDPFNSQCLHSAPDTDSMPAGCCLINDDCTDTDAPCSIGVCGLSPRYNCSTTIAADDTPCDNGFWCDGPEVCISGACVTRTDDVPCNGLDGMCRVRDCNETAKDCSLIVEYDTDSACDDGLFCNGTDICLAGDCVHRDPPCVPSDTDSLGACEELSCNDTDDVCEPDFRPNFSSCENSLGCDGVNMCFEGICESSTYCGEGDDCTYYVCEEDTAGAIPSCTVNYYANGKSCATPDLGLCFGDTDNTGRMCLNGVCSMGIGPMCNVTSAVDGFCNKYYCIESWGPGDIPSGGCGEVPFDPTDTAVDTDSELIEEGFDKLGCANPGDTDSATDYSNMLVFETTLEHNKVSGYGTDPDCNGTFNGPDAIHQISLFQNQDITITLSGIETTDTDTNGYDVHMMILSDACDATSCTHSASGSTTAAINNFIAPTAGTYYIVIDTVDRVYATGTLTVTCNN